MAVVLLVAVIGCAAGAVWSFRRDAGTSMIACATVATGCLGTAVGMLVGR